MIRPKFRDNYYSIFIINLFHISFRKFQLYNWEKIFTDKTHEKRQLFHRGLDKAFIYDGQILWNFLGQYKGKVFGKRLMNLDQFDRTSFHHQNKITRKDFFQKNVNETPYWIFLSNRYWSLSMTNDILSGIPLWLFDQRWKIQIKTSLISMMEMTFIEWNESVNNGMQYFINNHFGTYSNRINSKMWYLREYKARDVLW